ncbi:hypothetical protein QO796_004664, partial [Salmonella enterica]|nr:hypothetical protein [Salmonella enterica]
MLRKFQYLFLWH